MRLPLRLLAPLAVAAAVVTGLPAGAAPAPAAPTGLPDGVPAAARRLEPVLPGPQGWPFPEAFPRTSGTGRLTGGASYWTDFVLDDTGAAGVPTRAPLSTLAPTKGTYTYPDGPASGNGADVFRSAVGADPDATYWRVDWRTLVDPAVPVAVWALDLDGSAATGSAVWPGLPSLASPGTDAVLVVTAAHATLLRPGAAGRDLTAGLAVDRAARSFVLRVPRSVLPVHGTSTVRLAAGLADATGRGVAPVPPSRGALPGQPPVYDLAHLSDAQEAPAGNDWRDTAQAAALGSGDVTAAALRVDWAALGARRSTPEPRPAGSTVRWYVSPVDTGEGVGPADGTAPVYRGRVQPYAVYVPRRTGVLPLTLLLHSTGTGHGQYAAKSPHLLQDLCEDRGSLCVTPLGHGPAGNDLQAAEVDVWRVWRAAADAFRLDPDRTVAAGYSMGGYGVYRLTTSYPDVFAAALVLAGQPDCGPRVAQSGPKLPAGDGVCTTDGDTTALLPAARDVRFVLGQGTLDERIPQTNFLQHLAALDAAGVEYQAELRPAEDHVGYALKDSFASLIARLDGRRRVRAPGTVDVPFRPALQDARLGVGSDGAYWLSGLTAARRAPGTVARATATSLALPEAPRTMRHGQGVTAEAPTPGVVLTSTPVPGTPPAREPLLRLSLTDVATVAVDAPRAGFQPGEGVRVQATSDVRGARLTVTGLRPGTGVSAGARRAVAGADGRALLVLP